MTLNRTSGKADAGRVRMAANSRSGLKAMAEELHYLCETNKPVKTLCKISICYVVAPVATGRAAVPNRS
jgi:hypothetical protein